MPARKGDSPLVARAAAGQVKAGWLLRFVRQNRRILRGKSKQVTFRSREEEGEREGGSDVRIPR